MRLLALALALNAVLLAGPASAECRCALTLIVRVEADSMQVHDVYGLPHRCSSGSFSFDPERRIVQVRWSTLRSMKTVNIFYPPPPFGGTYQTYYCWGDKTAKIGNADVPVVYTETRLKLART